MYPENSPAIAEIVNRDNTKTNAITTFFKVVTSSQFMESLLNIPQTGV
jgi:hypothetical protein